jgi:hypothetical protein
LYFLLRNDVSNKILDQNLMYANKKYTHGRGEWERRKQGRTVSIKLQQGI